MTGKEAYSIYCNLQKNLLLALESFERKDTIKQLKKEILDLQSKCPHYDNELVIVQVNNSCPYCGKKL